MHKGSSSVPGRSDSLRCAGGKVKQSLVNGARLMDCQKSDQLIVAPRPVKAGGAKGLTNQQSPEAKHAWHRRSNKAWNMN